MRATLAFLAASAFAAVSGAALEARQNFPACVDQCIGSSAAAASCALSDAACLCQSQVFIQAAADCFASTCNAADAATGVAVGQQLCATVGYSVSIPAAASSALQQTESSSPATESAAPATTTSEAPVSSQSSAPAAQPTGAASTSAGLSLIAGLAVVGAVMAIL